MHIVIKATFFIFILIAPQTAVAKASSWANGSWGWVRQDPSNENEEFVDCGLAAMRVDIDLENMRYNTLFSDGVQEHANILFTEGNFLTLQYDGEKRLMENGEPHIWTMAFNNKDEFVWVLADWIIDGEIKGSTKPLRRCIEATV